MKFRCSRIYELMTKPREKSKELSDTAKGLIIDTYLQNTYGYKEDVMTDAMYKGIFLENEAIGLVTKVLGGFRIKNDQRFENDFVIGTPDVVYKDYVEDIKVSENIRTFVNAEISKMYEWQLQSYMWLTGKTKARLIYCLLPDPQEITLNKKERVFYKFNCDAESIDYQLCSKQIDLNQETIKSIPIEKRVRVFEIDFDPSKIEDLKVAVENATTYYNSLKDII